MKIKILYAIDSPIDEIKKYIHEGNDYPKTYLWWDFTQESSKYELVFLDYNKSRNGFLKLFEKLSGLRNIPYQLEIIRKRKDYDVIFFSLDHLFFLVIFFRYIGILKKPMFGLSHYSFNYKVSKEKWYWKLRWSIYSYFIMKGLDYVAFMGEIPLKIASEVHKLTSKNNNILRWGPDLKFYDNYSSETMIYKEPYFMAIGSSNRDYKLLIKIFSNLPYQLRIYQKLDNLNLDNILIPENVHFDDELKNVDNLQRHTFLRNAYKNSIAVLIPLEMQFDNFTGITCLYEAMACGKPVLVTDNIVFPIDVEKEKVGFKIPYGDQESWINAINFIVENKEDAKIMGEKGYQFIKENRNYEIYKSDLLKDFGEFVSKYKF